MSYLDFFVEEKKQPHPQLVSRITGRANLLEIMKHFPYLSIEQVGCFLRCTQI